VLLIYTVKSGKSLGSDRGKKPSTTRIHICVNTALTVGTFD